MNAILKWFRDHRSSTHALAAAIGVLAILVQTDTHIRNLLIEDLDIHPKIISTLACLGAILLAYKQPRKQPVEETDLKSSQAKGGNNTEGTTEKS